ncbi:hypothetical protein Syun_011883 [Stephania yunnanensis]|uniref:Secreted protein n=1 Tax=Stephania yunnanensis TaxID=152371 RepID=A0AAP0JYC7_9MAGN
MMVFMLRSLVKVLCSLVSNPVASLTTMLYYSDRLPRNVNLERLVRSDLLTRDNYLVHFIVNMLRCLW